MPGVLGWGWCPETKKWVKLRVDEDGSIHVVGYVDSLDDIGDVTIEDVADGEFLSWSDGLGIWQNRLLAEGDIPAEIARDAEVVDAISDHADLTTGIHGVGAGYVAESSVEDLDLSAHKARHKWLGDDEVELYDTLFAKLPFLIIDNDFAEATKWTQFVENTGSFTQRLAYSEMKSGATINSEVGIYDSSYWYDAATAKDKPRLMVRIQTTNVTDIKWAFGFFQHNPDTTDPVTQIAAKDKCIAFYGLDNSLYAVVGDGTDLTQTELGTNLLSGAAILDLYLRGRAANAIDFYVSKNAAAYTLETLATYTPAAGLLYLVVWMENFAGVAKQINLVGSIKLLIGAPF